MPRFYIADLLHRSNRSVQQVSSLLAATIPRRVRLARTRGIGRTSTSIVVVRRTVVIAIVVASITVGICDDNHVEIH